MALKILLNGSKGRMGQTIAGLAGGMNAVISAAIDAGDDPAAHITGCDILIDFSAHQATGAVLALAAKHRKPVVIGTTGHSAGEKKHLLALAAQVPCVWAGNFSVGVNLLFALTRRAAAVLGSAYDTEVIEMHHRFKKDAPSGTALQFARIVQAAMGQERIAHGREGLVGERPGSEIGMHAVRGGDSVGEHTIIFSALGETLELVHKGYSRDSYARGALLAAKYLAGKPAGLYTMADVLGLA